MFALSSLYTLSPFKGHNPSLQPFLTALPHRGILRFLDVAFFPLIIPLVDALCHSRFNFVCDVSLFPLSTPCPSF